MASVYSLITSRRPAHPVGWLFSALGLFSGLTLFYGEYAIYTLVARQHGIRRQQSDARRGELYGQG
ncbi:MAG: hypothetical protein M3317_01380 [Actinomycetota bacterium]|nr:hypothetical protein [Actinomycetota bacterium]